MAILQAMSAVRVSTVATHAAIQHLASLVLHLFSCIHSNAFHLALRLCLTMFQTFV